ncbi:MAG: acyl-CoA dehydrogenase family protein [Planctomycetota bacterium]|jgi:butyryl-CoA dehydrogenase
MHFSLTEEQLMIQEAARDFADHVLAPLAETADREKKFVWEQFQKAGELGFAGMCVPERYGGSEMGSVALSLALMEISRACASTGVTVSVHNSLACGAILEFGTEEQKEKHLPPLASGDVLGAYSLSEANAGSDAAALRTSARLDGDEYVIDGTKLWVSSGTHAGTFIVFVRTDQKAEKSHHGITALILESGTPGFTVGKSEDKMGLRGSSTTELIFDGARVPAQNLLGQEGKGFYIAMKMLNAGRIGIGAQSVGIAKACLDAAIRYSLEREQFGREIARFQGVSFKLAEMATRIEAARLLVLQASELKDRDAPHVTEASMAKLYASRMVNFCAKEALQIHGGAGYTQDFPVERWLRDARATEIYEGTTEIQKVVIARQLLRAYE